MNKLQWVLNIFAIVAILFFPHAELLPFFGYSIPLIVLTWFALKNTNESFSDIGFSFKTFKPKMILYGGLIALLTVTFLQLIFHPLLDFFIALEYEDAGLNDTIQGGTIQFLLMVIMGWLIGGFYEEIVFHGFIFTRLEKMIKGKYASQLSFLITSLLFGLYHVQLGPEGVVNALVGGAIYLALYLYFKRNLWYSIICHGFYNMLVMTLIYLD